jgi:hypothetical protein
MKYIFVVLFLAFVGSSYSQSSTSRHFTFSTQMGLSYVDTLNVNAVQSIKRFIYDTGSELTILDTKFAMQLNLKPAARNVMVNDILGYRKQRKTVTIDSLTLGGDVYYNIKAFITDLSDLNIDGIIGCNVLKEHVWVFNYPDHLITRYSTISDVPVKPVGVIPFTFRKGIPLVKVQVGRCTVKDVTFDTGNANPLSFAAKDTALLQAESKQDAYVRYYASSISSDGRNLSRIKQAMFSNIQVGGYRMDTTTAVFLGSSRTIGTPMLYHSVIVVDFPSKQIYFDKLERDAYATLGCQFGITKDGEIEVSSLVEGDPACKAGIKLDDILVSWEGYTDINAIKQAIIDGSIHRYKNNTVTVRMKGWSSERTIPIR